MNTHKRHSSTYSQAFTKTYSQVYSSTQDSEKERNFNITQGKKCCVQAYPYSRMMLVVKPCEVHASGPVGPANSIVSSHHLSISSCSFTRGSPCYSQNIGFLLLATGNIFDSRSDSLDQKSGCLPALSPPQVGNEAHTSKPQA